MSGVGSHYVGWSQRARDVEMMSHRTCAPTGMRLLVIVVLAVVVSGCGSAAPQDCPSSSRVDLSDVDPNDQTLPFRYPLDIVENHPHDADFCDYRGSSGGMFHAAEDFWRPAGTEVRSVADGEVSFSGRMGGYGWLVIVDHPEMNVYSLYGHLSPSRWRADPGPVAKGDLLGYLGDEWENGGSRDEPLVAHLHLGVRTGHRTDYSGKGEWRWMAGWIKQCPSNLGWLQPSATIAAQTIPSGGFVGPAGGLLERWWTELLIAGAVVFGLVFWIARSVHRRKPVWLFVAAAVAGGVGWYLTTRGVLLIAPIYLAAAVSFGAGVVVLVRRPAENQSE